MRRISIFIFLLMQFAGFSLQAQDAVMNRFVNDLMKKMTLEEKLGQLKLTTTLTNTGKFAGEEVVQLYIGDPVASISRPVKELKNFKKIALMPGEKKEVSFTVTPDDLKFYNADLKYGWEPGEFIIYAGGNSRDLKSVKIRWL
jgi:beta-glucosidase